MSIGSAVLQRPNTTDLRELNMHAMRMGPGKHLKGRTLMNGLVKPEEFDYFHEVKYLV